MKKLCLILITLALLWGIVVVWCKIGVPIVKDLMSDDSGWDPRLETLR